MIDIHPEIHSHVVGNMVQLEARVRADATARLPWRLKVESTGPGGRSHVTQSGTSDGSGAVVTSTSVNANAHVHAVLQVDSPDGRVEETTLELKPTGPTS